MKSARTSGNTINQLQVIKKVTNYESNILNNHIIHWVHDSRSEPNQNSGSESRFIS